MRYRLLGRLEVTGDDGQVISLAASKERILLAALLLNANRVVSAGRLIDALWGEAPPASAVNALQVQVSRLRKKLAAHSDRELLARQTSGYRLRVEPGELDVDCFQKLANAADGDGAETSRRLAEALGLWGGPALADVDSDVLRGEAARLEELRWISLERRIDADLALGRHLTVLPELEALLAEQPLREGFTRQLMVALYRSGRQAEALAVYRRTRGVLAEQLGIDPSPGLQAIELAVLNQAADLESRPATGAEASARALPSGTVTFLFTDIEGSTRLLAELGGERYGVELMKHRSLLREVIEANEGVEVGTEGDAVFAAFVRASDALATAREIDKALEGGPVRVRIGVHTGEPLMVDGDYVGLDVHRASRICSAAHGGQVLVSQTTRDLADVELKDLGEFRLKALPAAERLYQLGDGEFPPPRAVRTDNLPHPVTALFGREREQTEVGALLAGHRLVTLTGPGGSGKTRLALEVARDLIDGYDDGVWWVALAAIFDPALVVPTIAQALGTNRDLSVGLAGKRLLILIDNFEQVLDAARDLAALLAALPGLSLLVTSRERLAVAGEQEYPVSPLCDEAAVELFVARASEVQPAFRLDKAVGDICRRLDCLPLAIELAATRAKLMTTAQILDRLERRFELLTAARRDAPARHLTMRAAIDWSYDLLSAREKKVFRHLSVFPGTFGLEAAEAVCSAQLNQLQSLVDKSLVCQVSEGRFGLLETTRQHAFDRLTEANEIETIRARHAKFFIDLAAATRPLGLQSRTVMGLLPPRDGSERLYAEADNFRAVLDWLLDRDVERGVDLFCWLGESWWEHGLLPELLRWCERFMERADAMDSGRRLVVLRQFGSCLNFSGQPERAEQVFREVLALAHSAHDRDSEAAALRGLANVRFSTGHPAEAAKLNEQAALIYREMDTSGIEVTGFLARTLSNQAQAVAAIGRFAKSEQLYQEAIRLATECDDQQDVAAATHGLGDLFLDQRRLDAAGIYYHQAFVLSTKLAMERNQVYCLAGLASVAALKGEITQSALLWSAVESFENTTGQRLHAVEREKYERLIAAVAHQPAFQQASRKEIPSLPLPVPAKLTE